MNVVRRGPEMTLAPHRAVRGAMPAVTALRSFLLVPSVGSPAVELAETEYDLFQIKCRDERVIVIRQ